MMKFSNLECCKILEFVKCFAWGIKSGDKLGLFLKGRRHGSYGVADLRNCWGRVKSQEVPQHSALDDHWHNLKGYAPRVVKAIRTRNWVMFNPSGRKGFHLRARMHWLRFLGQTDKCLPELSKAGAVSVRSWRAWLWGGWGGFLF